MVRGSNPRAGAFGLGLTSGPNNQSVLFLASHAEIRCLFDYCSREFGFCHNRFRSTRARGKVCDVVFLLLVNARRMFLNLIIVIGGVFGLIRNACKLVRFDYANWGFYGKRLLYVAC